MCVPFALVLDRSSQGFFGVGMVFSDLVGR